MHLLSIIHMHLCALILSYNFISHSLQFAYYRRIFIFKFIIFNIVAHFNFNAVATKMSDISDSKSCTLN